MWFGVVTLFPEIFEALNFGILSRAQKNKLINIQTFNPRDYAVDNHKSVDDKPYGGGPGMVMMPEPLSLALKAAKNQAKGAPTVIYLSPQGRVFDQEAAAELQGKNQSIIFISGRYEGIDQRIIERKIDEEWSIGDYILSGGELAAMVMIDALTRLIPGVIGDEDSVAYDSLTTGLLKYPQYTRPESFEGAKVPDILLSGNHKKIKQWRLKQSLGKTWLRRPDLLAKKTLSQEESALLTDFIEEFLKK